MHIRLCSNFAFFFFCAKNVPFFFYALFLFIFAVLLSLVPASLQRRFAQLNILFFLLSFLFWKKNKK